MNLFKDFYENFVAFDSGYERMPQLILVCEDDLHMQEVFKQILLNNLNPSNIKIYFTTDLTQNSTTLEKSLFEFEKSEESGKYQIKNIEIKILA